MNFNHSTTSTGLASLGGKVLNREFKPHEAESRFLPCLCEQKWEPQSSELQEWAKARAWTRRTFTLLCTLPPTILEADRRVV